ncbi:hypothetical protein LguiB_028467 [Lonicera macranthoides]
MRKLTNKGMLLWSWRSQLEKSTHADTQMAIASAKKNLKELQKVAEEVEKAKSLAQTAREELQKAMEEAE